MNTPILDFVNNYAEQNTLRLHMPGHKGKEFIGNEKYDITEIDGADVLYLNKGIILESQENARNLFKTGKTLYSTEGSSLSIRAMIYLASIYAKIKNEKTTILAMRNAHKSFMNAVAMLDADVEWIYPSDDDGLISCKIQADELEKIILSLDKKPTALYVTSPDYLGNIADIEGYSKICKKHNMLLLVDNAHGAYLAFSSKLKHPIMLGADITCDSAHKTLPVITGGGYLHISKEAPKIILDMAETAMQIFASTSPSYLILSSLDNFNKLANDFKNKLAKAENAILNLKNELSVIGFQFTGNEPLKLTIMTKSYGYTGDEIAAYLLKNNIVCEFCDKDFLVMMFSPFMEENELEKLKNVLLNLPKKSVNFENPPKLTKTKKVMSIKDAIMSPSKEMKVCDTLGMTLASSSLSCPPAIPIVIAGEKIDENALALFKYYNIETCRVVLD